MRIRYIEEYRKLKEQISKQITSNPMYNYHFEYVLEDLLRAGKDLDLIVFKDGAARLRVRPEENNTYNSRIISDKVISLYPTAEGGFRVSVAQGSAVDADSYYRNPTTGSRPNKEIRSVMNVDQIITTVDADGVEIESVDFFTSGIPIRENCFSDLDVFTAHTLTQGVLAHDGSFDEDAFNKSKQSCLKHEYRDPDNPALVTRHYVNKDSEGEIIREDYFLGVNMTSFAEVLKLDDSDIFAKKSDIDDEWTVIKECLRGGDITIQEAIKKNTNAYNENLESSRTKKDHLPQYEPLRKRCDTALDEIEHRLVRA